MIVSDNGTELASNAILQRADDQLALHRTGSAGPECLCRVIIGRLRDELLNEILFRLLAHARAVLEEWRADYNNRIRRRTSHSDHSAPKSDTQPA
jgi:putative transposase